jgi:hypothetical protein
MTTPTSLSRCHFLTKSVAAALPSEVLAKPRRPGADFRIRLGFVGVGRRGKQILAVFAGAEMVALCEVYDLPEA